MPEHEPGERRAFVGISTGVESDDATLGAALKDAARHAVERGAVTKDGPVWYDLVLQVEVGNQHIRTFRAALVPRE